MPSTPTLDEEHKMHKIMQTIGQVSLFGPCDASVIQSLEWEKKKKDEERELELIKRAEENRKIEEENKKREEEDYNFALQEHARMNGFTSPSKGTIGGRGYRLLETLETGPRRYRGRGRLTERQLQNDKKSFDRIKEDIVTSQIGQFVGEAHPHSNRQQILYWQGDRPFDNYTAEITQPSRDDQADITQHSREEHATGESIPVEFLEHSLSDFHIEAHSKAADADSVSSSYNFETSAPSPNYTYTSDKQHDYQSSYSDSPCGSDQFEDVESDSLTTAKPETPPLQSYSSSSSASPVQQKACGKLGIRKPKPRVNNFLSKKLESASESSSKSNFDFFRESTPNVRPATGARPSGISINSLRASDRIIDNVGITSFDVVRNYNKYPGSDMGFVLKQNEFPPL